MRRALFVAACAILGTSDAFLGWYALTDAGGSPARLPASVTPSAAVTTTAAPTCQPVGVFTTDPRNGRTIITVVCRP